jgi:E3 ubiquitin-protein ligase HUWE1
MSRWTDEERIIFGELAPEHSSRLRNHVVNALMPKWKESSSATTKQQQQKDELAEVNSERDRILEELNQIRARLARNEAEVAQYREGVARQRESLGTQDGQSRATEASASAPQESSNATGQEDVEMNENSQPQQPTAQAQAQAQSDDSEWDAQVQLELTSLQQGLQDLDSALARTAPNAGSTEAETTGQPDSSAAAEESTGAAAQTREMFSINGREVDITDLGIDREVLDALPEEMQEEVVSQALREHRAATVPGHEETSISPEFLDALPPELRAEVLEQEAAERAQTRREQAAAEARSASNAAAAAAPATTSSQQPDSAANPTSAEQRPPGAVLAEGLSLGRPATRGQDGQELPGWLRTRTAEDFSRRLASMVQQRRGQAGQNAASGGEKAPPRDAIQLLDSNGIAALIRLLFFPTLNARQSGLHKVLANLSQNSKTRTEILSMLLRILSEGSTDVTAVDRSYASMSARAQGNTPGKPPVKRSTSVGVLQLSQAGGSNTGSAVAPLSRAGEEAPFLIASRSIETLLHLTNSNDQAALYFLREDPRMVKKNKGKEKEKGSAPVNILLGLLEKPSILGNAQVVDSLIALLNTVTKPIPGLAAQAEKDAKAEEEAAATASAKKGGEEASVEAPGSSTTTEAPALPTASADGKAPEQDAKEDKDKDATSPTTTKPPHVAKERLAAVVRPLATAISSKGFQHTLAVASHLASIDSDSRQAVTEALQREATAATAVLSENLDMLLATLPPKKTVEEEEADEKAAQQQQQQRASGDADVDGGQSESQPRVDRKRITSSALPLLASPASAQARLLRSLRAIEWLHGGR